MGGRCERDRGLCGRKVAREGGVGGILQVYIH